MPTGFLYDLSEFIGKKYGRWTILSESLEKMKDGKQKVHCVCDCGTERDVCLKNIIRGGSVSCGCFKTSNSKSLYTVDEVGKRYGTLTVERMSEDRRSDKVTWICVCDCGEYRTVTGKDLRTGKVKSCISCTKKAYVENMRHDLSGQRFTRLVAISRSNTDTKKWVCCCDCGKIVEVAQTALVAGLTQSCGCYCRDIFRTFEHRKRNSAALQGIPLSEWNGFVTPERKQIRKSEEYKDWRAKVLERDNYTCQRCGCRTKVGKDCRHHVHHIYPFHSYPDLRYEVSNGITLCYKCHYTSVKGSFHNIYGTRNNTPEQLKEFIYKYRKERGLKPYKCKINVNVQR